MKILTYKLDEKKVLFSLMNKGNSNQKELIYNIIESMDQNSFNNYTMILEFENKGMRQKFTDNNTGETFYQSSKLPVLLREMYHKLFTKLYWKYCN